MTRVYARYPDQFMQREVAVEDYRATDIALRIVSFAFDNKDGTARQPEMPVLTTQTCGSA